MFQHCLCLLRMLFIGLMISITKKKIKMAASKEGISTVKTKSRCSDLDVDILILYEDLTIGTFTKFAKKRLLSQNEAKMNSYLM